MAAPKGNSYWRQRLEHGRKHKIKEPEELLESAIGYLEHLKETPMFGVQVIAHQGEGYDHQVPKMRSPTLQGFWIWSSVSRSTWYEYKERDGFSEVCAWIEDAFHEWKFEGAAAGLLNHAIIARDLGLKEHTDITSDDKPVAGIVVSYD